MSIKALLVLIWEAVLIVNLLQQTEPLFYHKGLLLQTNKVMKKHSSIITFILLVGSLVGRRKQPTYKDFFAGIKKHDLAKLWYIDSSANNWAEYWIPAGKGLNKGDGEFMIADKFVKNGWQNYRQSRGNPEDSATGAAERNEAWEWWK